MQDSENLIIFFSTCMISLKVEKGGKRHRSVSYIHVRYLLLMIKIEIRDIRWSICFFTLTQLIPLQWKQEEIGLLNIKSFQSVLQ